ncbi:MAG TPA: AAA family ATPase [Haliangium sp.]|nr:AAA family ATPase [Haliangium sp.]
MPPLTGFRATFRCLRDVEMDFTSLEDGEPSPFIAMVGPNGVGKTTVLEAIAQSVFFSVRHHSPSWFLRPGEHVELRYPEGNLRRSMREQHHEVVFPTGARIEWYVSRHWTAYSATGKNIVSGTEIPEQIPEHFSTQYWPSLPAHLDKIIYIRSGYLPVMPIGRQLEKGPAIGMNLELALLPQDAAGVQHRIDAVHQWWLHMHWEYPKTTTLDRLWAALKPFLGDLVYAGVNPQDHLPWFDSSGTRVSFNDLSSGQRRLILLFLEIVMQCGEDGLVLFDEPEAHFHPIWQEMLPDALCQLVPRGQVIVATHAPHIVEGRPAHQVFVLGGLPWEPDVVE